MERNMSLEPDIDHKYYLSAHNVTAKQPAIHKSVDISRDLIVYGTDKSTGALFIYKREPYAFFKAISGYVTGPIEIIRISNNQQVIAFSNGSSELAIYSLKSLLSKANVVKLEAPATALHWHHDDNILYVGDAAGNVSVVTLSFFIGRNLLTIQVNKILDDLEGPIVQIDSFNDFLLVSSTTKTILCNNDREEFKQIGNRPRDGHFGGCFIIDYKGLEAKQNKLINIDEETYESLLLEYVKIYTCRPGMRLWEADLNGNVLKTHQFKNANFSGQQIYLISSRSSADSSPVLFDKTNQFQRALPLNSHFVFTFNDTGFYIIDPKRSKIVFWTNEFDGAISDVKIVRNSDIYIYLRDGRLFELKFYKLQHYALHLCHSEKDFLKAGDLIRNNLEYFMTLLRASGERNLNQYKVFLKIRDSLIANEKNEALKSLSELFDELASTNVQNVMILSKNFFNKEPPEETIQVLPITKQSDEDSLSITSAEVDRAVKQLYIIHQTYLISNLNFRERLSKIFDHFKSSQIIRILDELEKLFIDNDEYSTVESKRVVSKMFLEYLQPEIIFEIDDEKTLSYIASALLLLQTLPSEVSRCKRCEFPLNCGSSSSGYEEIGNILQQFYWSRKEYDKCYDLCRTLPHLLKITGKFNTDERKFDKMIPYAINLGDLEILHKSLELFNDISLFHQLIDDYIQATKYGKFKCLKCDEINEVAKVHKILTWDCLFQAIEYYLNGQELIDLLVRYSQFIPNGALSRQFYMKLLLHAYD